MVIYVPNSIGSGSNAPTLFWFVSAPLSLLAHTHHFFFRIHGGSFTGGSASDPAINGANLAAATQSIVAVVQYRLGGVSSSVIPLVPLLNSSQLGFMAPNGETNLAVKDIINALNVLKAGVPMIGGSASKITIAGQSSGATMVRTLLAIPSASPLFRSAILQSDPMVISSRVFCPPFIHTFSSGLRIPVSRNATDHAELFQPAVFL